QGAQDEAGATMDAAAIKKNGDLVKKLHSTTSALHKHRETPKPSVDIGQHTSTQGEMESQKKKWEEKEATLKAVAVAAHKEAEEAGLPAAKKTRGIMGFNKKRCVDHPVIKQRIMLGGRRKRRRTRRRKRRRSRTHTRKRNRKRSRTHKRKKGGYRKKSRKRRRTRTRRR
ncbi:hypothetical protein N9S60_00475, partial [bacterium]|nr:hypothetical protein [bacterium]